MMTVAQLRVLGGAMARVPVDATAFAHRKSKIMVNVAALYENPEEKATHEAWVADFASALLQSDKGAYVNFLGDEGEERIRAAYPGSTWDRLARDQGSLRPDQPLPAQPEHRVRQVRDPTGVNHGCIQKTVQNHGRIYQHRFRKMFDVF